MKSKLFRRPTALSRGAHLSPEGHLSSRVAALSGLLLLTVTAAAQDFDLEVCGEYRAFSLVSTQPAEGAGVITYKWYENDIPIDNSNTASICITEGRPAGTYAYVRKASSEACPEEAASNIFTVEVLEAPAAPTLTLSAETVCAGNSITFTATGGSGTYEWSCSSFTCSGDGASMPTPTVPGSYSAQVRSVTSVAGHSCSSDSSPLVTAFIRSRGSSGQTPDVVCGCEPNLCNANVVCLAHDDDCALCTAMCRVYTAGGTPLYQVYRSGDPAQCRCVTTQSTVYGGTPYHQLYVLNGSCSAITLIGETTTYIAYEAANSARCW